MNPSWEPPLPVIWTIQHFETQRQEPSGSWKSSRDRRAVEVGEVFVDFVDEVAGIVKGPGSFGRSVLLEYVFDPNTVTLQNRPVED